MRQNIRSLAMVASCVAGVMALPSVGRSQGWYLNADAGVALGENVDLKRFGIATPGVKLDLDAGARLGVAGGYNFTDYVGAEVETGLIYNSIKKIGNTSNVDASLSHIPFMANVVFRYDQPTCDWVPYAGAGAGMDLSVLDIRDVLGVNIDDTDTDGVFAWQVFAGLRYKFNADMSIGAGYKYFSSSSASWDFGAPIEIGKANVHSILIEFNVKF